MTWDSPTPAVTAAKSRPPNLDSLARGGLRFTQFYNTARCWPSRACLLTGYYAQAVRRDALPGLAGGSAGIRPPWARLLPEHLKPLGYRSYHSGKWHVDGRRLAGGFDRSYSLEDHDRYFGPTNHFEDDTRLPPAQGPFYTTTFIADHAIKCLRQHAAQFSERPFFQYLAFTSPHFPLQARPEDIALYQNRYRDGWDRLRKERHDRILSLGLLHCALPPLDPEAVPYWNLKEDILLRDIGPDEVGRALPWASLKPSQQGFQAAKMAVHAAMVHRMDIEIGRVLDQVRSMGAWSNTIVLFLSDNGASAEQIIRGDRHDPSAAPGSARTFLGLGPGWSSAANTPFRMHKSWVHEGGIATPLIVHWPAGIKDRGQFRAAPGHITDLSPTLLELAGGAWPAAFNGQPVPPPHGRSLAPVFQSDITPERGPIWWAHDTHRALREGDWKLVACRLKEWELYNLRSDRSELTNLAAAFPDKVRALEATWTRIAGECRALGAPARPQAPAETRPQPGL